MCAAVSLNLHIHLLGLEGEGSAFALLKVGCRAVRCSVLLWC